MQSKKTLLFKDSEPWVKKDDEDDFNVPMGCYYVAEVYKLVGTYLIKPIESSHCKRKHRTLDR